MISMRMKKFYKKTGRKLQFDAKEPVGFDKTKVECYNCHKTGHFARECRFKGTQDNRRRDAWNSGNKDGSRTGQKEDSKALVTVDGEVLYYTNIREDEGDYALRLATAQISDTQKRYDGILSYENEVLQSVFMNKKSEIENQPLYDRFVTAEGMHVVPPPMTGNYMPSGPDVEVDDSKFTYGPKQTQPNETETQSINTAKTSGTKIFSTDRQSVNRQTVLKSTAMKVNTVKPIVNRVRPANVFNKTHSSSTRPFKKTTVLRPKFSNQKFNTAKVNAVSTVGGKRETAVKPSAGVIGDQQRYHGGSKDNSNDPVLGNCNTFKRSTRQTPA
ncbi:ribonuclease H-like domain-containing protein [Tanacetum coccineum]